jgi:hypothetical protein
MVMNLADMLSYADIHQLSRIAEHYECQCSSNSKNQLIQSILSTINRRDVSESLIKSSSMEDLRFLNSLLFEKRNSFSLEELIARVELTKFAKEADENWNPRDMIAQFKQRGWLFNGYSQQTKYLFQIPQDLKKRFSSILAAQFQKSMIITGEPAVYRDEQKLIQDDIYHFLHFVYHQDIALTAEGFMYKRHVQQILERFSLREDSVQKEAWRFGYGRRFKEYPNRFSFIYDYCYFNEYILEENETLLLSEKGKSQVLDHAKAEITDVYRFWIKLYKTPVKNLQSFVFWIDQLAKQWITVESLKPVLCDFIKPFYFDSSETILEQRILQMMMHLGLLRLGEDENEGKVVQITKLGTQVIQGTYVKEDENIDIGV